MCVSLGEALEGIFLNEFLSLGREKIAPTEKFPPTPRWHSAQLVSTEKFAPTQKFAPSRSLKKLDSWANPTTFKFTAITPAL
jgi:hypothetical protein